MSHSSAVPHVFLVPKDGIPQPESLSENKADYQLRRGGNSLGVGSESIFWTIFCPTETCPSDMRNCGGRRASPPCFQYPVTLWALLDI